MTRPTADRTRQALFDVLTHAAWAPPIAGAWAVDLFAGSGALGLEALSRGAARALFVETSPAASRAITGNLEALGLADRGRTLAADAANLPANPERAFDLAFLDPPYAQGLCEPVLMRLAAGGWLAPGAILAVERGAGEAPLHVPGYRVLDDRSWGAARVWFLTLASGSG